MYYMQSLLHAVVITCMSSVSNMATLGRHPQEPYTCNGCRCCFSWNVLEAMDVRHRPLRREERQEFFRLESVWVYKIITAATPSLQRHCKYAECIALQLFKNI